MGLRANVSLDLDTAARALPSGRFVIPLVAIAIAAGFGLARPGYASIYGESLLLIVLLTAAGAFGRTLGIAVVLVHGITDMIRFILVPDGFLSQLTLHDALGRLISYGVLWLVVVYVPSVARGIAAAAEARRGGLSGRFAGAGIGAAVAGIGTYLWSNLMPYLFGAVYHQSPAPQTLQPQQHPELLSLGVAAAYLLVDLFLRRRRIHPIELRPLLAGVPRTGIVGLVVRILGFGVLLVGISGIMTTNLDAYILIGSFVVAEIAAAAVGRWGLPGTGGRSARTISLAGSALSVVVVIAVGWVANRVWPNGLLESRFLPIILSLAVAFPIARVAASLAARAWRADEGARKVDEGTAPSSPVVTAAVTLGVITVVLAAMLVMPATALADNCASLGDCFFTALFWGVMFSFGGALLSAANFFSPPHAPDSVPSNDPRLRDFNKLNEKSSTSGPSNRFKNITKGANDFFGGGGGSNNY